LAGISTEWNGQSFSAAEYHKELRARIPTDDRAIERFPDDASWHEATIEARWAMVASF